MKRQNGFTLIELMIVVIILAALAGMVVPKILGRSEEAKLNIAKADIANLSMAIKLFRLDNERYPENLGELTSKPSNAAGWKEAYLEKPAIDPWKHSYQYNLNGGRSSVGFDVFTSGPDGENGTSDDIGNWQ